jgi:hypothetical protein
MGCFNGPRAFTNQGLRMIGLYGLLFALMIGGVVACSREPSSGEIARRMPDDAALEQDLGRDQPRQRWRLTPVSELSRTVLWLSHIEISYARAPRQFPWSTLPWWVELPTPGRDRREAMKLAVQIADEVRGSPQAFAELARQYSDDLVTRERGGSLGGVRASDLMIHDKALDRLASLGIGDVSSVIETNDSFFLFLRRSPPPALTVSGERIVIGYDGARWLTLVGATFPQRSRADALSLAQRIYETAKANPERFDELVTLHSEHPDRARGGDMGTWSLHEPTPYARELELLSEVAVGEVAPPIDSMYGIEIMRRTADKPRPDYAMRAIKLPFAPGAPASEQAAEAKARDMLAVVRSDPNRFAELLREAGSPEPERWVQGRDEPGLSEAMQAISIGEITPEPVRQYLYYVVAQRCDPGNVPFPPSPRFELPAPERVDLTVAVTEQPYLLEEVLSATIAEVLVNAELASSRRDRIRKAFEEFRRPSGARTTFQAALLRLIAAVQEALAPVEYSRFEHALAQRYEALMLGPDP